MTITERMKIAERREIAERMTIAEIMTIAERKILEQKVKTQKNDFLMTIKLHIKANVISYFSTEGKLFFTLLLHLNCHSF